MCLKYEHIWSIENLQNLSWGSFLRCGNLFKGWVNVLLWYKINLIPIFLFFVFELYKEIILKPEIQCHGPVKNDTKSHFEYITVTLQITNNIGAKINEKRFLQIFSLLTEIPLSYLDFVNQKLYPSSTMITINVTYNCFFFQALVFFKEHWPWTRHCFIVLHLSSLKWWHFLRSYFTLPSKKHKIINLKDVPFFFANVKNFFLSKTILRFPPSRCQNILFRPNTRGVLAYLATPQKPKNKNILLCNTTRLPPIRF